MIEQLTKPAPSQKSLALVVSSPDACKFLQGQLTCDVAALADNQSTLGAYCTIKGKVQSLFTLQRIGDEYILYMPIDLLEATQKELQKYAAFSKVKLTTQEMPEIPSDPHQEILAKIPAIYPQTVETFFPHDLNLPALGAVSFTKGCYRGQEIVARMQHRGNLKRSLYIFNTEADLIQPGNQVHDQNHAGVGTIVRNIRTANGQIGLAVITDSLASLALFVNDAAINVRFK